MYHCDNDMLTIFYTIFSAEYSYKFNQKSLLTIKWKYVQLVYIHNWFYQKELRKIWNTYPCNLSFKRFKMVFGMQSVSQRPTGSKVTVIFKLFKNQQFNSAVCVTFYKFII